MTDYRQGTTATLLAQFHAYAGGPAADVTGLAITISPAGGGAAVVGPTTTGVVHEATGLYSYAWAIGAAQATGTYVTAWSADGGVTASETVYVTSATTVALVPLDEVKKHLNIPTATTTHDDELRTAILTASDVVEGICGAVASRTIAETHSGRGRPALILRQGPVLSITSVAEHGTTLDTSGYSLDDGVLYRVSGYSDQGWKAGRSNITVTYVAGRAETPPSITDAVKELVRINFRTQLGGNFSPFDTNQTAGAGTVRLGFFVPNKIASLLEQYAEVAGIA